MWSLSTGWMFELPEQEIIRFASKNKLIFCFLNCELYCNETRTLQKLQAVCETLLYNQLIWFSSVWWWDICEEIKLHYILTISCMVSTFLSDFKENFWNTGAAILTFEPSASLQNYSSFRRSLNELGTSKVEFLNWITVDILGWITLCWEGGHPVCCRMFSNIPDLYV